MLSFTQVNLHKADLATILLGRQLENKTQVIALVTEPHTTAGKITGMPRGTTITSDKTLTSGQPGPRAGIISSRDLKVNSLEAWCHRDCAAAIVRLHGRQVLLASIYLDINKTVSPQWLEDLMNMASNKRLPVIIGVDTNAHSSLYGPDNNSRGDEFEDFVLRHGLEIHNDTEAPTYETRRGNTLIRTHIDVTLSRDLHFPITDWAVDREYNASDHNTISFRGPQTQTEKTKIRPWSKADWTCFGAVLRAADYKIPTSISMKKLDKLTTRLYELLEDALDAACPKISVTNSVKTNHWATDKHTKAKAKVTELYRKAKRTNAQTDWDEYKAEDKKLKHMCRRDRNKSWREYKESIQTHKDMASLARLAQRQERHEINVLQKPDGTSTDPGEDTIQTLAETHFPHATGTRHVTYNNRRNILTQALEDKYQDWISPDLVRRALDGFEKKKSPGPDEIKPLIFEHLPPQFLHCLLIIYKSCIHLGYTPKAWKKTKVIFISKPGKESYDKPKSFRPISLSNYFLKGLERLVGWNMDRALVHYPIHHKQHGFLSGKSTESAISNTTDYIERHIMQKQHCVGVFLDISSAFDSIKASHVRRALLDHGGDPEMVQWYYNYMTHRDIEISLHGALIAFTTGVGFPQGGVCSAKFWLIAFDFAIKIINTYNIEGNGYADDCSALYGGPRLDHAISRLQKMLDSLAAWGRRCGLHFNPEKSVAVVFTRSRKTAPKPLYIDGKPIAYKQEVRYLGVTLDSKLHWKTHIDDKIHKAKRFIQHVASITRKNWGPKPSLMRWAYLGIVRPMLCYGAMAWGHRAQYHSTRLKRVNRMAINTFGSFPKSTPTAALEVMLDILPLELYARQEGLASRSRLNNVVSLAWNGTSDKKTHAISHLKYWDELLHRYAINPSSIDRCTAVKWSTGFRLNRDSFNGATKHRTPTQYNLFSDGSHIDGQTGCGYAIYRGRREIASGAHRLPDHCTVFQAEIVAAQRAVMHLLSLRIDGLKYVKIFIDSRAALLALSNPNVTSQTVSDAVDSLNELTTTARSVTLCWIPAHKGHIGNERADELAKLGASGRLGTHVLQIRKPKIFIKNTIRDRIYEDWTTTWQADPQAQHAKSFYLGPCPTKAKYVYRLARLELGRFVRLITGHNNLNYFQHKIGLSTESNCRFCGEAPELFTHLITDCPNWWRTQRDHFLDQPPGNDMQWSVRTLLEFSYIPRINEAFEGSHTHGDPLGVDDLDSDYTASDQRSTPTHSRDHSPLPLFGTQTSQESD